MTERIGIALMLAALLACHSSVEQPGAKTPEEIEAEREAEENAVTAPSGEAATIVECDEPAECWKKAGALCPRGYVDRPLEASGTRRAVAVGAGGNLAIARTSGKSQMLVECRIADGG